MNVVWFHSWIAIDCVFQCFGIYFLEISKDLLPIQTLFKKCIWNPLFLWTTCQNAVVSSMWFWLGFISYLSGHTQSVRIGTSESPPSALHYGVPQGSVLGSDIFIVYNSLLPASTRCESADVNQFSDDTSAPLPTWWKSDSTSGPQRTLYLGVLCWNLVAPTTPRLVQALVLSRITYCNVAFSGLSTIQLDHM